MTHRWYTFLMLPKWLLQFMSWADANLPLLTTAMIDIIKFWNFCQNDTWKLSFNLYSYPYYWSRASIHVFVVLVRVWFKPSAKSKCIVENNLVGGWNPSIPIKVLMAMLFIIVVFRTIGIPNNLWLYLCLHAKGVKKWFKYFFNILGDKQNFDLSSVSIQS